MKDRELNESIVNILIKSPEYTYNYKQIASILGIKDSYIRKRIVMVLSQLEKDGQLNEISRGKYQIKNQSKELKGNLQVSKEMFELR